MSKNKINRKNETYVSPLIPERSQSIKNRVGEALELLEPNIREALVSEFLQQNTLKRKRSLIAVLGNVHEENLQGDSEDKALLIQEALKTLRGMKYH